MTDPTDPFLDEMLADLADHSGPDPKTLSRLRRRLRPSNRQGSYRSRRMPAWAQGAVLLAAAGAALWVGGVRLSSVEPRSFALDATVPATLAASEHVALSYQGRGLWRGRGESHDISWEAGHLDVEVEPDQGVRLLVSTEEAAVEVVGTRFGVDRGPLGTTVTVHRGKVRLTCSDGEPEPLTAGTRHCPRPVEALHAHAVSLIVDEADPADILEVVDLALASGDHGVLTYELIALRASALSDLGRTEELVQTLQRYLDGGPPMRRAEFQAWLDQLKASGEADGEPPRE